MAAICFWNVDDLHVLARRVRPGEPGLGELGEEEELLRAATGDADLLALEVGDLRDGLVLARDEPRAALREAGDHVDLPAPGAVRDRGVGGGGGDVDLAPQDGGEDVDALREDGLLHIDPEGLLAVVLHERDRAVVRELEVAELHDVLRAGGAGGEESCGGEGEAGHPELLGGEWGGAGSASIRSRLPGGASPWRRKAPLLASRGEGREASGRAEVRPDEAGPERLPV
jgi:hypothetical protein